MRFRIDPEWGFLSSGRCVPLFYSGVTKLRDRPRRQGKATVSLFSEESNTDFSVFTIGFMNEKDYNGYGHYECHE
jgi:hypothetical protein